MPRLNHDLARIVVIALLAAATVRPAAAQVFRPDDPLRVDHDDLPSPLPTEAEVDDWYDGLENLFAAAGDRTLPRAQNINTLGEVPDSSWFTNRIGSRELSRAELVRGPDQGDGPSRGAWSVVGAKSMGVTPGFTIEDGRGHAYFIKFDPPSNPEMATAADVISTKLFHALGYNVPENYIVTFDPANLTISPKAKVKDLFGNKAPMTQGSLDALLTRVAHNPDGTIRALASRRLPGKPIGSILFHGTRPDDLNDLFPHEHRRELRGYSVFCAWLNHDDSRSLNTLDIYRGEPGQGHVEHYLIDFGSGLGSASIEIQSRRAGNEYILEWTPVFKSLFSLGLWLRPWVMVPYDEYPSIGRLEAEYFQADTWRPEYPNVAFDHMDLEDAWWAASRVMAFTDDDLAAIVATGQLSDPAAARHLTDMLIARRDKTGEHWLRGLAPFERFAVVDGRLTYGDVLVRFGLEPEPAAHAVTFHRFDNATGETSQVGDPLAPPHDGVVLPSWMSAAADGAISQVRLASGATPPVDVYLRLRGGRLSVIGVDRNAPRMPALPHSKLN